MKKLILLISIFLLVGCGENQLIKIDIPKPDSNNLATQADFYIHLKEDSGTGGATGTYKWYFKEDNDEDNYSYGKYEIVDGSFSNTIDIIFMMESRVEDGYLGFFDTVASKITFEYIGHFVEVYLMKNYEDGFRYLISIEE